MSVRVMLELGQEPERLVFEPDPWQLTPPKSPVVKGQECECARCRMIREVIRRRRVATQFSLN